MVSIPASIVDIYTDAAAGGSAGESRFGITFQLMRWDRSTNNTVEERGSAPSTCLLTM